MKKLIYLVPAAIILAVATTTTAHAGFIGTMRGTVTGPATLLPTNPVPPLSTDTTLVDATNGGDLEFEGVASGNLLGFPGDPRDISLTFDLYENVGLTFLDIYSESISDQWEFANVMVTFDDWSRDDGLVLTGVSSYDDTTGLTWDILTGGSGIKLNFGDYEYNDYGRSVQLELTFGIASTDPEPVPVPAAWALGLLGMGGIALKRWFA